MAEKRKDHVEPHDSVGLHRKLTIDGCSDSQYLVLCIIDSLMFDYNPGELSIR
jgi:hypothetical protein